VPKSKAGSLPALRGSDRVLPVEADFESGVAHAARACRHGKAALPMPVLRPVFFPLRSGIGTCRWKRSCRRSGGAGGPRGGRRSRSTTPPAAINIDWGTNLDGKQIEALGGGTAARTLIDRRRAGTGNPSKRGSFPFVPRANEHALLVNRQGRRTGANREKNPKPAADGRRTRC